MVEYRDYNFAGKVMEFFVTHQTVEHFSGDCAVTFVFKDKTHQNKDLQQLLELNRFDATLGATLMLSQVSGYKTCLLYTSPSPRD